MAARHPVRPAFDNAELKDIKPTGNVSLTWVRGNHTFKAGGTVVFEGFPQQSSIRALWPVRFRPGGDGNPYENGLFGLFPTGFNYASFLMGRVDNEESSAVNDTRLGNHSFGVFIQDNWKVTRKLTLDYGLRWDYATLLSEQYGRMQNANFLAVNPQVGLPGSIEYGATCNCQFNQTYPFSIGPRLGLAYQISPKTVFRAGAGISYSSSADNAFLSYSVANFYTLTGNGYGNPGHHASCGRQDSRPECGNIQLSDIQPVPISDLRASEQEWLPPALCAVHFNRQGHGQTAPRLPVEHRDTTRDCPEPSARRCLCRQSRRMVGGSDSLRSKLQRPDPAATYEGRPER